MSVFHNARNITLMCTVPFSNRTRERRIDEIMPSDKSVHIVANGGDRRKNGSLIDSGDLVVRFNDFALNPYVGEKFDVHFVNGHPRCNKAARTLFRIECDRRFKLTKNRLFTCPSHIEECTPSPSGLKVMCNGDSTRGFMAISLFRRKNMRLFGFSGKTHYYDRKAIVRHNVELEHEMIEELGIPSFK